jgi:CubicO group peptidase (beta-lactamase class C family)
VTVTAPDGSSRTAVHHAGLGSTILPEGADSVCFTPVPVVPDLPDPATTRWPMGDLLAAAPPPGIAPAVLDAALDRAMDDAAWARSPRTRGLVVVAHGQIVAERYAPGFDRTTRQICWSTGKSITAALIGILIHQGYYALDDFAPIAEWKGLDDPRRMIRIRHLLNMSSGLLFRRCGAGDPEEYVGTSLDDHMYIYDGAIDVFAHAISRSLEFVPGTFWRYRNCDPLSLGAIVRRTVEARGEAYLTFPQRALFDKIGIRDMVLEPDPWGNFIMTGYEWGTPRDWARFALLHLWDGVWMGERILPEGWTTFVSSPAPADYSRNYGGQFWLNAGGAWPDVPRDAYWAAGAWGQYAIVIPSRDLVIVRMGQTLETPALPEGRASYMNQIVRDILAAVRE